MYQSIPSASIPPQPPPPPSAPQAFHFLPPNFVLRFITYRVKGLVPSSVTEAIKDVDPTHFVSPPPLKWTCKIYVIKKAFDVIQFKNSGFHKQFSIHISELFQYFSLQISLTTIPSSILLAYGCLQCYQDTCHDNLSPHLCFQEKNVYVK